MLTLYNAELTAVGVKAKYATVFLLFTECLQIKYIHYILDWDKIKIYIKAKKKKTTTTWFTEPLFKFSTKATPDRILFMNYLPASFKVNLFKMKLKQ